METLSIRFLWAVLLIIVVYTEAKQRCRCEEVLGMLEQYHVDARKVSVSGFSSGGAMATQFHFIHSSFLKGAAIFSGTPYMCAEIYDQNTVCRPRPDLVNVEDLIWNVKSFSDDGLINNVKSIQGQPVYIYHGQKDTFVPPQNSLLITKMYEEFGANVQTNFRFPAEHGMITTNFGAQCGQVAAEVNYITDCDYNGAYHALNTIYGGDLIHPRTVSFSEGDIEIDILENDGVAFTEELQLLSVPVEIQGELITFDTTEFFEGELPQTYGMNETGYLYVPSRCNNRFSVDDRILCKLHLVFHGCFEYTGLIDEIYIRHTGYLEVADANDIILLFPQTIPSTDDSNKEGCWDVWGVTDENYATKFGRQSSAIFNMLQRILGIKQ